MSTPRSASCNRCHEIAAHNREIIWRALEPLQEGAKSCFGKLEWPLGGDACWPDLEEEGDAGDAGVVGAPDGLREDGKQRHRSATVAEQIQHAAINVPLIARVMLAVLAALLAAHCAAALKPVPALNATAYLGESAQSCGGVFAICAFCASVDRPRSDNISPTSAMIRTNSLHALRKTLSCDCIANIDLKSGVVILSILFAKLHSSPHPIN